MALRSRLFAGYPRLEACAVNDSAHLTLGARGTHVGKVQYSLDVIDRLKIDRQELIGQIYGPSTAQAVLSFKSRRAIINRAYQSTADNIVGRMTIVALDNEMLQRQNLTPATGECARDGGGGLLIASGNVQNFTNAVGAPAKGPPQLSCMR